MTPLPQKRSRQKIRTEWFLIHGTFQKTEEHLKHQIHIINERLDRNHADIHHYKHEILSCVIKQLYETLYKFKLEFINILDQIKSPKYHNILPSDKTYSFPKYPGLTLIRSSFPMGEREREYTNQAIKLYEALEFNENIKKKIKEDIKAFNDLSDQLSKEVSAAFLRYRGAPQKPILYYSPINVEEPGHRDSAPSSHSYVQTIVKDMKENSLSPYSPHSSPVSSFKAMISKGGAGHTP